MSYQLLTSTKKGAIGEKIASTFLMKAGFSIVEKNYLKKWGEIDIVAKKKGRIHFFEVKSTIVKDMIPDKSPDLSPSRSSFRPEENVHILKQRRLRRVIQTYLIERGYGLDMEFSFHIIVVRMNTKTRRAAVSILENIIL